MTAEGTTPAEPARRPLDEALGDLVLVGQLLSDFTPYLSFSRRASGVAHLSG